MPVRSILKTTPWLAIVGLLILGAVAVYFLDDVIRIAGPPDEPVAITQREIACELIALIIIALLVPPMPDTDLRRSRARGLAVVKLLLGLVLCLCLAAFAARLTTLDYLTELRNLGAPTDTVPESELIIGNTAVVAALMGILVPLCGRLLAFPCVLVVWVASYAPPVFSWSMSTWPLDYLQDEGPWMSPVHIAAAVILTCVAIAVQWMTAGMGSFALQAERVGN
ncbi:MAG: hypothetical protein SPJ78_09695 [Corynebacterium camporealensis]|uniref:hypothetical protein n=1 Tax=Corynebacterium camporealensis TaxID=161896 RepID=UPI002A91D0FA|nr:hypothetical protein [Corynebacterium camporealensis]MDY5840964.1 hypothetical protein [Corynebacterium camporealensis]